jgi:20S proteasome subunit alpha 6
VEYAIEAIKQGSACVGCKSNTHVVLASIKRAPHTELSAYQQKLYKVDNHIGIAVAGLAGDGRVLAKYLRTECLNHKYVYESPVETRRLVIKLSDKSQISTQTSSKRPFGVGLLVSGFDQTGTHLFQTEPSGNFYSYKAIAIGARSQSAKTYFEKHFEKFALCDEKTLIKHALVALRGTTGDKVELTSKNTSISVVSVDGYRSFDNDSVGAYLDLIKDEPQQTSSSSEAGGSGSGGGDQQPSTQDQQSQQQGGTGSSQGGGGKDDVEMKG